MSKHALHNALFNAIFNDNRTLLIELLRALLTPKQLIQLDLRTTKYENNVFTDAQGKERRADIIFSVMTKDGQRIVFVVEHKSSQDKALFSQLLVYQQLLNTITAERVVPIVISNAAGKWHLPRRFRTTFASSVDLVAGETALDFGYLLLHLPDYSRKELKTMFPKSHPYLIALHNTRNLSREAVGDLLVSSLSLPRRKRILLIERATDCYAKFNRNFSFKVLKDIELEVIPKIGDRLMHKIKLGREGWLEEGIVKGRQEGEQEGIVKGLQKGRQEGRQEGIVEIARRMLADGMDVEIICRITGLTRREVSKLTKQRA